MITPESEDARAAYVELTPDAADIIRGSFDELRRTRMIALNLAAAVARDRAENSGIHPGADQILITAGEFFDFIWGTQE